jgi:hypothetical protein
MRPNGGWRAKQCLRRRGSTDLYHSFPGGFSMIQRILVLGGGSAVFLTAISLKTKLPDL